MKIGKMEHYYLSFFILRGTEKQHVAYDYAKRLSEGAAECSALIADVLAAHLVTKEGTEKRTDSVPAIETCSLLNVSICPATETNNVSPQS